MEGERWRGRGDRQHGFTVGDFSVDFSVPMLSKLAKSSSSSSSSASASSSAAAAAAAVAANNGMLPEVAAAAALAQAVDVEEDEEDEEFADIVQIPFGKQEDVEEAMTHARTQKTTCRSP